MSQITQTSTSSKTLDGNGKAEVKLIDFIKFPGAISKTTAQNFLNFIKSAYILSPCSEITGAIYT